ncbi:MAG: hypothetical protein M9953_01410 [Thermomicrobiales bacterium]|nr:hypothetical protein [Thermomicrobiales bacterium]
MPEGIPAPVDILGHVPGEAGWLPTWDEMVSYFDALAAASDRVLVERQGVSTTGLPYLVVTVSAPENLTDTARIENRARLEALWDARVSTQDQQQDALENARTVGFILATQHSSEIGAALMTMQLAYELATTTDAETLQQLYETIHVLIPSHNPDGINIIHDWYDRIKDTEYDDADLPYLYHPYTGHDNNRDWFMLTQIETRNYVDIHNREHPQAVFDMHQMGRNGARFMVPPFIDPLDPNQDPIIQQGFASLGTHIAQRLTSSGKGGVVTNAIFDNFSPSLAYGNYHGSVDLLSEAASVKLATSVEIKESELESGSDFDPRKRTWNHPLPWLGGAWTLAEIVEYDLIAARAFFQHLSVFRKQWLRDYQKVNAGRLTTEEKPYGFIIPQDQRDAGAAQELIDILQLGLVDVDIATEEVTLDGVVWPSGTRIVSLSQPAGDFAKTLLEIQEYPDLRKWKGGPPLPPYDIVGHTLPMQMGVRVFPIEQPIPGGLAISREETGGSGWTATTDQVTGAFVINERENASVKAITALTTQGIAIYRARESRPDADIRTGAIIVPITPETVASVSQIIADSGASTLHVSDVSDLAVHRQTPVRLGVYRPNVSSMDEGWARWVLEEYGFGYTTLLTNDIKQGNLRDRFDCILIPHITAKAMREGQPEKNPDGSKNVPEYVGGLGQLGMDSLREFVTDGGTLIGIDAGTEALVQDLALPASNALSRYKNDEFYCPGSLVRIVVDNHHPLGYGLPRDLPVLFMSSVAFDTASKDATTVAHYPSTDPLMSGWILGARHLERKSALVDVRYGDGTVVLIGFRPYFRAQTRGSYRVLFNAILRAGYESDVLTIQ